MLKSVYPSTLKDLVQSTMGRHRKSSGTEEEGGFQGTVLWQVGHMQAVLGF